MESVKPFMSPIELFKSLKKGWQSILILLYVVIICLWGNWENWGLGRTEDIKYVGIAVIILYLPVLYVIYLLGKWVIDVFKRK